MALAGAVTVVGTVEPGAGTARMFGMRGPRHALGRFIVALGVLALAACGDSTTASGRPAPITTADVAAVTAAGDLVLGTMSDPALVSLLGVHVPFSVRMAEPMRRAAVTGRQRQLRLPAPEGVSFLGDAPVDAAYLGSTFVRAGTVFRRDTSRRDAPVGAVRVLLYERQGGAANARVVGWVDMADSTRSSGQRVTRAVVGTATMPTVATVRGSLAISNQGVFGFARYDVLGGTLGSGAQPIVVSDSFVVDSTTGDVGRNVITTRIPSAAAIVRSQVPVVAGGSTSVSRLLITVGNRTVRVEGQRINASTQLTFYNGDEELGVSTTADLPNLGNAAHLSRGGGVSDVVRLWMNAVGRLLIVTPAAADLSQATGNLVTLLDPLIP